MLAAQKLAERHEPRANRSRASPARARRTGRRNRPGACCARWASKSKPIAEQLRDELSRQPAAYGGSQPSLSPRMRKVTDAAEAEAGRLKDDFVSTEHLLLGIVSEGGKTISARILQQFNITKDRIFEVLTQVRGAQRVTDQNPEAKYQALEKYGRDLTELARRGKLDPVIGRDEEIRRVIQVLFTAHEEQSGAHRRARRRQNGDRRGSRRPHRQGGRARGAEEQEGRVARHGRAHRRARNIAASSKIA